MQSSPQLPMSSRDRTPAAAAGDSWGAPDTPRPSAWEDQPVAAPAAQAPAGAGGSADIAAAAGTGQATAGSAVRYERDSWAAGYVRPDTRSAAGAANRDAAASPAASSTLQTALAEEARGAARLGRPTFRERTDSAIYHRDEEAPEAPSAPFRGVRLEPVTSASPAPARENARGSRGVDAGRGGAQGQTGERGLRGAEEADARAHVLQAELGTSVVQLCRRTRESLDAQAAPGPSAAQVRPLQHTFHLNECPRHSFRIKTVPSRRCAVGGHVLCFQGNGRPLKLGMIGGCVAGGRGEWEVCDGAVVVGRTGGQRPDQRRAAKVLPA